jgi:hypothetical protein
MDVWMVVSVLGWLLVVSVLEYMFGWFLVCWDRCLDVCWGGWMDAGMVVWFICSPNVFPQK